MNNFTLDRNCISAIDDYVKSLESARARIEDEPPKEVFDEKKSCSYTNLKIQQISIKSKSSLDLKQKETPPVSIPKLSFKKNEESRLSSPPSQSLLSPRNLIKSATNYFSEFFDKAHKEDSQTPRTPREREIPSLQRQTIKTPRETPRQERTPRTRVHDRMSYGDFKGKSLCIFDPAKVTDCTELFVKCFDKYRQDKELNFIVQIYAATYMTEHFDKLGDKKCIVQSLFKQFKTLPKNADALAKVFYTAMREEFKKKLVAETKKWDIESLASDFNYIRSDKVATKHFIAYLKRQRKDENISFITAVEEYRNISNFSRQELTMYKIFNTFISEVAKSEINISGEKREQFSKSKKLIEREDKKELLPNIFDNIYDEVIANCANETRQGNMAFKESEEFKEMLKELKISK